MNSPHAANLGSRFLRNGFTLVELILSLAVSGLLLAAVSTSMLSGYKAQESGQRQIDDARTLASLAKQLRRDIADVVDPTAIPHSRASTQDPGAPLEVNIRQRVLQLGFEFQLDALALDGTSIQLTLGKLCIAKDRAAVAEGQTVVHQAIVWSAANNSKIKIPFLTQTGATEFLTADQPKPRPYAGPVQRNTLRLDRKPSTERSLQFPSSVSDIQFRYFDGQTWHSRWNSAKLGGVPAAVEFRLKQADTNQWTTYVQRLASSEAFQ